MERGFEILIVDDDVNLASNLQDILEMKGYSTAVAHDGQSALTLCREKAFDLGFIDIKLPDMPGVKLVERVAKLSPGTEHIIITGHASLETAVEAVRLKNIIAYETKPLNMDHILALMQQVAERRQAEQKVAEYAEIDNLKTSLLSIVSHELRTPLAIAKGCCTMLLDYDQKLRHDEKREYLESINRATDRSTELVNHLLDLSGLEAGLLKMDKQPTTIPKLIKKAAAEAKVRVPSHEIVADLRGRLPTVNVDARRIRQVIDNIIDNAVKHSGKGTKIVVKAWRNRSQLQFSIADEGIGIPAKDLERVFDRMYHIEYRQTPETGGFGLGLALCKGLVEAHGGRIWVESKVGKGSIFYFALPIQATAEGHGHDAKAQD